MPGGGFEAGVQVRELFLTDVRRMPAQISRQSEAAEE